VQTYEEVAVPLRYVLVIENAPVAPLSRDRHARLGEELLEVFVPTNRGYIRIGGRVEASHVSMPLERAVSFGGRPALSGDGA